MAKSEPALGAGDVEIDLHGEKATLRCSLEACLILSSEPGGLVGENSVLDRVSRLDLNTHTAVIRAGLGLTGRAVPDLSRWIFEGGLGAMRPFLQKFIINMANKGAAPTEGEAENPQKEGAAPS